MSDFQNYLDTVFADLDTRVVKEENVYNYDIYKKISTDVIKARKESGLTQSQLAEKSGLTQANISNIEKGSIHPTIDSLQKIAAAVNKKLIIEFRN